MSNDPFSLNELKSEPAAPAPPAVDSRTEHALDTGGQVLAAINALNARLDRSDQRVERVTNWISKEVEAKRQAKSASVEAPVTRPPRTTAPTAAPVVKTRKAVRKIKNGSNLQAIQTVLILILFCVVGWFMFDRGRDPEATANIEARQRSVTTMRRLSESMAEGLLTIAEDLRTAKLNEPEETGKRLKEVISASLDTASAEQLDALDAMKPWKADTAADRFEAAAHGFSDSAGRLK